MKKVSAIIVTLCTLTLTTGALLLFSNNKINEAQAGAQNTTIVNDNFNMSNFAGDYNPSKWLHSGDKNIKQSQTSESYVLNDGSSKMNGESLFYGTKQIVNDLEYVQLDMKFYNTLERWLSIKFFSKTLANGQVGAMAYNGPTMIYPNKVAKLGDDVSISYTGGANGSSFKWATGEPDELEKWMTFRFEVVSESVLNLFVSKQGGEFDKTKYVTYTLNKTTTFNFKNCQVGIQTCDKCKFALDNFKIKGSNVNIDEDYSSAYEDEDDNPFGYLTTPGSGNGEYIFDGSSTLDVYAGAKNGDRLLAKKQVKEDTSISQTVQVIDAKFSVKFNSANTNTDQVAYVFGLPSTDSSMTEAGGALIINKATTTYNIYKDGEIKQTESWSTPNEASSDNGLIISFILEKNGLAKIQLGDNPVNSVNGVEKYKGYTGFAAISDVAHVISLDNVLIKNATYYVPVTKSVTHNFSNNFFGNPGFEDFYIPGSFTGNIHAENGQLQYTKCSDDAFFGSAYQYDCFIMDYKLCSIYVDTAYLSGNTDALNRDDVEHTKPGSWIGLDLSRATKSYSSWGSYGMVYFEICPYPGVEEENLHFYVNDSSPFDPVEVASSIKRYQTIPTSLFRNIQYDGQIKQLADIKEQDYVCVRWISDGTNLDLYLKTNGEAEFTKYATIPNLELNGWFAMSNPGYVTCSFDDFSMANTSTLYICADNEAPETVTETETVVIYDGAPSDASLKDEINLNKDVQAVVFLVTTIVLGVVSLGLGATLIVVLLKKKKAK